MAFSSMPDSGDTTPGPFITHVGPLEWLIPPYLPFLVRFFVAMLCGIALFLWGAIHSSLEVVGAYALAYLGACVVGNLIDDVRLLNG